MCVLPFRLRYKNNAHNAYTKSRDTVLPKRKTNTSCLTVKKHETIKFKSIVISKWNSGKAIMMFSLVQCKHFGSPCSCCILLSENLFIHKPIVNMGIL